MARKTIFIKSDVAEYTDSELATHFTEFNSEGRLNHYDNNDDLEIIQDSSGASMNVEVRKGACIIEITKDGEPFKTINYLTANEKIQISSNSSGITRHDAIIGRTSTSVSPNELKNNIFTVEKVEGLSGSTPTGAIPTDDEITAIVGNDGWVRLANITVASGSTTIVTANISNIDNPVQIGKNSNNYKTDFRGDGSNLSGIVTEKRDHDLKGTFGDFNNDYQNSYKRLASFQPSETWTDGTADTSNYLTGTQSIKVSPDGAEAAAYMTVTENMSEFADGATSHVEDDIKFVIYADSISNLTACGVRFYTSAGNLFYYSAHASLAVGWNYFSIAKSAFSETGTPDWGTITKIEVYGTTSSGEINLSFTALNMVRNTGTTSVIYEKRKLSVNSTATSGTTLTIGSNDNSDRFTDKDYSGYYLRINNATANGYGKEYLISSNTDNVITTVATLPTITENVDWEIWKPDFDEQDGFWVMTIDGGYIYYSNIEKAQTNDGINIYHKNQQDCSILSVFKRKYSTSNNNYGLVFRYIDVNNYYFIKQDGSNVHLYRKEDSNSVLLASSANSVDTDTDTYIKVQVDRYNIRVYSSTDGVSWTKEIELVDSEAVYGKVGYIFQGSSTGLSNKSLSIFDVSCAEVAEIARQIDSRFTITGATRLLDNDTAGESISIGEVLAFGDYSPQDDSLALETQDTAATVGYAADQLALVLKVKVTANSSPEYMKLMLSKTGTPDYPLFIQIYSKDGANNRPDWDSNIGGVYPILPADLTTSLAEYELPLSNFEALTTSDVIYVVLWTKQAADTSDYYSVGVASSSTSDDYSYYKAAALGATSITSVSTNDPYIVLGTYADNDRLYKLDASTPHRSLRFAGVAISAGGEGENVQYVKKGKVGGFTGLTRGLLYYASTTAGEVTATPPAYGSYICLGRAVSSTEIYLDPVVHIKYDSNINTDPFFATAGANVHISYFTGLQPLKGVVGLSVENGSILSGSIGFIDGAMDYGSTVYIASSEYYSGVTLSHIALVYYGSDYVQVDYIEKTQRGITLNCSASAVSNQQRVKFADFKII